MKTGPSRQLALNPSVPNEMRFQVCDTSYYHTQWRIQRRGPGGPPPLIFRPNWGPKNRKFFFLEIALFHPYLRVWMTCTPLPPPLSQDLDLASTLRYHHSPLVRIARIGHFTVRWKRHWSWPCFDTTLSAFLSNSCCSYANKYFFQA